MLIKVNSVNLLVMRTLFNINLHYNLPGFTPITIFAVIITQIVMTIIIIFVEIGKCACSYTY